MEVVSTEQSIKYIIIIIIIFRMIRKRLLKIYNFNRINVLYFYSERNRINNRISYNIV